LEEEVKIVLNPVIKTKVYEVWNGPHWLVGEVQGDDVHEAWRNAREQFGKDAQCVIIKKEKPCVS
jgi:hypothetical protein